MKMAIVVLTIMTVSAFFTDLGLGQDLIVFPANGQTQEQVEKDKSECYGWAKQETGFDPMQSQPPAQAAPAQSQPHQGQRLRARRAVRQWALWWAKSPTMTPVKAPLQVPPRGLWLVE